MIDFLAGVPGKLKTLSDRLSSDWAAKIDALRTGLTDARMGYLDKLNITGNVASAADVAALSGLDSPLLKPPIASGLMASSAVNYDLNNSGHTLLDVKSNTSSTSYSNVVNYTGAGVLEFCAFHAAAGSGTSAQMEIIIDGVTVYSGSSSSGSGVVNTLCPVGAISTQSIYTFMAPGAVPFKTSLQIRHKATGATTCTTACKYRKA